LSTRSAASTIQPITSTVDSEEPERQRHWASTYAEKDAAEVSWFESLPSFSLAMLDAVGADPWMAVIDVGAGVSWLGGTLLRRGLPTSFTDITALDVSYSGCVCVVSLGCIAGSLGGLTRTFSRLNWRSPSRRADTFRQVSGPSLYDFVRTK
jgi:hypothetical protein